MYRLMKSVDGGETYTPYTETDNIKNIDGIIELQIIQNIVGYWLKDTRTLFIRWYVEENGKKNLKLTSNIYRNILKNLELLLKPEEKHMGLGLTTRQLIKQLHDLDDNRQDWDIEMEGSEGESPIVGISLDEENEKIIIRRLKQ